MLSTADSKNSLLNLTNVGLLPFDFWSLTLLFKELIRLFNNLSNPGSNWSSLFKACWYRSLISAELTKSIIVSKGTPSDNIFPANPTACIFNPNLAIKRSLALSVSIVIKEEITSCTLCPSTLYLPNPV